jgi:membrane-associated phospholipid phosphatase
MVVFTIALGILFVTMLLNWLYMDPLYQEGVNMIYHNQKRI